MTGGGGKGEGERGRQAVENRYGMIFSRSAWSSALLKKIYIVKGSYTV